jgi:DNA-binding transcriptional regulator GbsR (MarR family)
MPIKRGRLVREEETPDVNNRTSPSSVMFVHNQLDEYGLDPYEFRVYAHAVRRTGGKLTGKYFASLSKTAEICQMSVRRVQYSLKFLCEAGFLIQEKRTGRTDEYKLTDVSKWAKPEDLELIREAVTGIKRKKTKGKGQSAKSSEDNYTPEQRQTLVDAVDEIQRLLNQLEQTNPTATQVQQKAFVTAAIPLTKRKLFANAFQACGKEVFKEFLDKPYTDMAAVVIKEWQKAEKNVEFTPITSSEDVSTL